MSILKNNNQEKLENRITALEALALKNEERLKGIERRITHLIVPAISTLLDETIYSNRRGLNIQHPLVSFVLAKLRDEKLNGDGRKYLSSLLENVNFESHRSLKL